MKNYYEILEVNETASQEVISRVYKMLAKKYHPDLNPENPKQAEEKFKEVSEAYEILSDEKKRKEYDEKLALYKQKQIETTNSQSIYNNYSNYTNNTNSTNTSGRVQYYENVGTTGRVNSEEYINKIKEQYLKDRQKAYNDAYVDAMKKMGYKVVYRKTFKEKLIEIRDIFLTIIILIIIIFVLSQIPIVREKFFEIYDSMGIIKDIINGTINFFKQLFNINI